MHVKNLQNEKNNLCPGKWLFLKYSLSLKGLFPTFHLLQRNREKCESSPPFFGQKGGGEGGEN